MSNSPLPVYDALRSPGKSPHTENYDDTRYSQDSDESLRALEISDGPLLADVSRPGRGRSYSVSGFDFQNDLLPLSASLSEPESVTAENKEKHIGLVHGE
jgi:hypothetical protein